MFLGFKRKHKFPIKVLQAEKGSKPGRWIGYTENDEMIYAQFHMGGMLYVYQGKVENGKKDIMRSKNMICHVQTALTINGGELNYKELKRLTAGIIDWPEAPSVQSLQTANKAKTLNAKGNQKMSE